MATYDELWDASDAALAAALSAEAAWKAADDAWQASRQWRNNENEDGYRDEGDRSLWDAANAAWDAHAQAQAELARAMHAVEDWEDANPEPRRR